VDEIGAVEFDKLLELRAALDAYKKINPFVKVIVLGDPNQMTSDTTEVPLIEKLSDYHMPGLPEMTVVDPLVVRYRSDNPSIVNIQDTFIDKTTKVENLTGKINMPPSAILGSDQPINGVFVEDGVPNILGTVKSNITNAPNRTRAIIVASEEMKEAYKSKLTSVLGEKASSISLMTYVEAQGISLDEVYVDIPYNDQFYPQYNGMQDVKRRLYNKAMYTASSRGTQFVYLGNIKGGTVLSDPSMDQQVIDNMKSKSLNFESAIDDLAFQLDYYKMMFPDGNVPIISKPQPTPATVDNTTITWPEPVDGALDPNEDPDTKSSDDFIPFPVDIPTTETIEPETIDSTVKSDLNEEDVEDVGQTPDPLDDLPTTINEEPKTIVLDSTAEFLNNHQQLVDIHPQSYAFDDLKYTNFDGRTVKANGLRTLFKDSDRVNLTGFKLLTDRSDKSKFLFVVARQLELDSTDPSRAKFMKVAVLGREEYDRLPDYIKNSNGVELESYDDVNSGRTIFTAKKPNNLQSISAVITNMESSEDTKSHDMKVVYGNEINNLSSNFLQEIVEAVGGGPEELDNARIRIFSRKGLIEWEKKTGASLNMPIAFGAPYLVIPFRGRKNPILIRLTPKRLSNNNFKDQFDKLSDYISKVEAFSNVFEVQTNKIIELGDTDFAYVISTMSNIYRHFVPNEDGKTKDLGYYEETSTDGKKVKTAKQAKDVLNSNHEHYGKLVKMLLGETNSPSVIDQDVFDRMQLLFQRAYDIDSMIHGENYSRRMHKGPVQNIFDKIAKSNLVVYLNDFKGFIPLRDERIDESKSTTGNVAKKLVGRSLIGPINPFKAQRLYNIDSMLGAQLAAYYKRLSIMRGNPITDEEVANVAFKRFLDSTNNRVAFNVKELKEILSIDSNTEQSTINKGFGLRVPIAMQSVNNKRLYPTQSGTESVTSLQLEEHFETNFKELIPIKMSIFTPKGNSSMPSLPSSPTNPSPSTPTDPYAAPFTNLDNLIVMPTPNPQGVFPWFRKYNNDNLSVKNAFFKADVKPNQPEGSPKVGFITLVDKVDRRNTLFNMVDTYLPPSIVDRDFYENIDSSTPMEIIPGTIQEDENGNWKVVQKIRIITKPAATNPNQIETVSETLAMPELDVAPVQINKTELELNLDDLDSLLSDTAAASNDIIINSPDFQDYYLKLLSTDPGITVEEAVEYFTKCK